MITFLIIFALIFFIFFIFCIIFLLNYIRIVFIFHFHNRRIDNRFLHLWLLLSLSLIMQMANHHLLPQLNNIKVIKTLQMVRPITPNTLRKRQTIPRNRTFLAIMQTTSKPSISRRINILKQRKLIRTLQMVKLITISSRTLHQNAPILPTPLIILLILSNNILLHRPLIFIIIIIVLVIFFV